MSTGQLQGPGAGTSRSRVPTGRLRSAASGAGSQNTTDRLRALELKESLLSQAIEELEKEANAVTGGCRGWGKRTVP